MALFSIPVMQLPEGCIVVTPETLPVTYEGEEVATARLDKGSYTVLLSRGNLLDGLTHGSLMLRPLYFDEPGPNGTITRKYLAVEILNKKFIDLYRET